MIETATSQLDLDRLPLILAGPILRRVEPHSVTVWLALQSPCQVYLRVMASDGAEVVRSRPILTGIAQTISLGKALHVVAVTAQVNETEMLIPEVLYAYDLSFKPNVMDGSRDNDGIRLNPASVLSLQQALRSADFPEVSVSYLPHGLPTFSLPPLNLNRLRIFHGSCRKVHDKGIDALPIVDQMIAETASQPLDRPHYLFFTGDQIYGDEVADPLLWGIQQIAPILLGWSEPLAVESVDGLAEQLQPGNRQKLAEQYAGLTASEQGDEQKTNSHFLLFSEYCISYLFSWSECFWRLKFPMAEQVGVTGKAAKEWNQSVQSLVATAQSQSAVRRALANVPTYMIFDDHDVSDDWNINQAWCLRVLGKPLGRQVVRNALLAYAMFQAWGNTPEQFVLDQPGARLLAATEAWCEAQGTNVTALAQIYQVLGLPSINALTDLPEFRLEEDCLVLARSPHSLKWHYRVSAPSHEVIVLDTRTQRGYPLESSPDEPPQLLSAGAYQQQLLPMLKAAQQEDRSSTPLTLVIAPTNVFTLGILDRLQALGKHHKKSFDMDIGDSWNLEGSSRWQLLQTLFNERQQVILLSGDIHYGAALRVDYWHNLAEEADRFPQFRPQPSACLVQLTASAICNSETITEILQTKLKSLFPERRRYWMGSPPDYHEIEVTPSRWRSLYWKMCRQLMDQNLKRKHLLKPQTSSQPFGGKESWGYRSEWLARQPVKRLRWNQPPAWLPRVIQAQVSSHGLRSRLLAAIWQRRWLQEGKEVVGLNNIGLVRFSSSEEPGSAPIVIYDLYWYAPWKALQIVYSRYSTPLKPYR